MTYEVTIVTFKSYENKTESTTTMYTVDSWKEVQQLLDMEYNPLEVKIKQC